MAAAAASARPWRIVGNAVVVRLHLTPRASRDGIEGVALLPGGPALKARVRAPPEDGKANAALETLLAQAIGLARRAVSVTGGHASRLKSVTLDGDARVIIRRLEQLSDCDSSSSN